jgi:hypothetical protein
MFPITISSSTRLLAKIFLLFLGLPITSFCQKIRCPDFGSEKQKKFEFGVSIGNNGQLDRLLDDFYFLVAEASNNNAEVVRHTNIKYNVTARYFFSENISVRLRIGEAKRKMYYLRVDPIDNWSTNYKQNIINFNPSICFSKMINALEISTGFEIPIIFVGEFNFNEHYKNSPDSINVTYESSVNDRIDGGFIWGLNNFLSIKYFLGKNFSISSEINYGLLSATLGNKRNLTEEYIIPAQQTVHHQFNMKYKDVYFSYPEFSFGINYRL